MLLGESAMELAEAVAATLMTSVRSTGWGTTETTWAP